jgi:DNA-binding CsgD family transcriptional regulator
VTTASDYHARVNEIVRQIESAQDRLRAVELLREATPRMGAQVSIFASFIRDDAVGDSYRLLLDCDPQWAIEYAQHDWYANDPWLNYAIRHTEPIRGTEIKATSEAARAIVALTQRYGFASAVIVPTPSSSGMSRCGVLCLGSSIEGYFEAEGYLAFKVVARSVAMELHEWWLARLRDELLQSSRLNAADLVLLGHELMGHTTKDIARTLGMTVNSIDSRFQRINAKLGVANRKAAARLAAEYGLI